MLQATKYIVSTKGFPIWRLGIGLEIAFHFPSCVKSAKARRLKNRPVAPQKENAYLDGNYVEASGGRTLGSLRYPAS